MDILITGISGFIGRSLVEEIINKELPWNIFGIDIKKPLFNDNKYFKGITFDIVDIRSLKMVNEYFSNRRFDGVIHLAAVSRVVDAENDKANCINTNLLGTKYLLESISKTPDTWVIFGSSREVYGEQKLFPVKESAEKKPINIYGVCKLRGEVLVKIYIKKYVILRFSNVYGNNYDIMGRVIPNFVMRSLNNGVIILEGGKQILDFTYINDTVDCIIKAAELLHTKRLESEDINICPGKENKITDIIYYLSRLLNRKLNVSLRKERSYDVNTFVGDTTKRKKLLLDKEFLSLKNGLKSLLELKK